jgi:hypothetical protein
MLALLSWRSDKRTSADVRPRRSRGASCRIACCRRRATGWLSEPRARDLAGWRPAWAPITATTSADSEPFEFRTLTWISAQTGGCQGPQANRARMLACSAEALVLTPTSAAIVSKAIRSSPTLVYIMVSSPAGDRTAKLPSGSGPSQVAPTNVLRNHKWTTSQFWDWVHCARPVALRHELTSPSDAKGRAGRMARHGEVLRRSPPMRRSANVREGPVPDD